MNIQVKAKPNAQINKLEQHSEGQWSAQIKSPPVNGKANQKFMKLVASHFKCRKSEVSIKGGAMGWLKLIQIEGF